MEDLVSKTVPDNIRLKREMNLEDPYGKSAQMIPGKKLQKNYSPGLDIELEASVKLSCLASWTPN